MGGNLRVKGLIIGEGCGDFRTHRNARRACQRGHVDQQLRRLFIGSGQGIGKDQAPLRIRIADLHRLSFPACQNITGAEGIAGNGIFDRRDQNPQPDWQSGIHDHIGKAQHRCRAAHILFHHQHGGRGFKIKTARIETHPLADQCYFRGGFITPCDVNKARCVRRRPPHRMHHREVVGQQILANDICLLRFKFTCHLRGGGFQTGGAQIASGQVDQVSHQSDRLHRPADHIFIGRIRQDQRGELLLAFFEAIKDISCERPACRHLRRFFLRKISRHRIKPRRQLRRKVSQRPDIPCPVFNKKDCVNIARRTGE